MNTADIHMDKQVSLGKNAESWLYTQAGWVQMETVVPSMGKGSPFGTSMQIFLLLDHSHSEWSKMNYQSSSNLYFHSG